ncbi:hypothetical protein HHL25_05510 [Rhizobium sp. S-51]|uniref:Uncharacterized protein n=1 Tax=Rhizobium terricola TaxID=2728849 RepID=A0A7Y0AU81_9HYPH|nr:hypothetical protein [Rhizobium terricola]NML73581.1 hypothetical protein [Rhizobium terricola]
MAEDNEQKKTERLHMLISPAELEAIDEWRFANRIGTRAEAVRRLCQIGLIVGRELEGLADAATEASDAMSELDNEIFGFWTTIASPVYKSDTLNREAIIEEISDLSSGVEKVNGAVDQLSSILVGLFAASTATSRLELGEGKKRAEQVLEEMQQSLQKIRDLRAESAKNHREMTKYAYRKSDGETE